MTIDRAKTIEMARQCGCVIGEDGPDEQFEMSMKAHDLERFYALVRAQVMREMADSGHSTARAGEASTAPLPGYPRTPQAIREFIGPHFRSREDAKPAPEGSSTYDGEATEDDVYTLTVHDLLSAFDWWADLPPEWMKPHPQCDQACMYVCTEGFTRFPSCVGAECEHGQEKPSCGLCHDNALAKVYGGRTASTGADTVRQGTNVQAESASPSVLLIRGEK